MNELDEKWRQNETTITNTKPFNLPLFINSFRHHHHYYHQHNDINQYQHKRKQYFLPSSSSSSSLHFNKLHEGYNYIKNFTTQLTNNNINNNDNVTTIDDNDGFVNDRNFGDTNHNNITIKNLIESIITKKIQNVSFLNQIDINFEKRIFNTTVAALTSNFTATTTTTTTLSNLHYENKDNLFHLNGKLFRDTFLNISNSSNSNSSSNSGGNSNSISNSINSINDIDPTDEFIQSGSLLFLIIIYGFVILCGVLGNASLVITLFSTSSIRLRNPILVALCIADLFVAGISAPTTIITLALTQKPSILTSTGCKVIYYLQSMPTAASTISFLMLSLDRFITVQHPKIAQIRQRRYVHSILAIISWLGASAICLPFVLFYKLTLTSTYKTAIDITTTNFNYYNNNNNINHSIININKDNLNNNNNIFNTIKSSTISSSESTILSSLMLNYSTKSILFIDDDDIISSSSSSSSSSTSNIQNYLICQPDYDSNQFQTTFVLLYTIIVYIFPGLGVLINHYGVHRKLCALSLTARAAHGELPLPMPILRRPTHVIIVTGMANAARGVVSDNDDDDDDDDDDDSNNYSKKKKKNDNYDLVNDDTNIDDIYDRNSIRKNMVNILTPKSPRAMREIRTQQRRQRLEMNKQKLPVPGLPLPQTSTLRSRRRLANMLIVAAFIFLGCWTPHVLCILWSEFGHKQYCNVTMSYASLLLGYTHSAISPIIYWILNYNALRQSPCAPFMHISTVQRFFRTHLRPTAPPPPSSTNEAALGAFNPRYIKATPKQYRAQASSHYLY